MHNRYARNEINLYKYSFVAMEKAEDSNWDAIRIISYQHNTRTRRYNDITLRSTASTEFTPTAETEKVWCLHNLHPVQLSIWKLLFHPLLLHFHGTKTSTSYEKNCSVMGVTQASTSCRPFCLSHDKIKIPKRSTKLNLSSSKTSIMISIGN